MVERILDRGPPTLRDSMLTIYRPEMPKTTAEDFFTETMESRDGTSSSSILICGLTQVLTEEILVLFFENTKRSGGGEIESIEMEPGSGTAIVHFCQDAGRKKSVYLLMKSELFFSVKISQ